MITPLLAVSIVTILLLALTIPRYCDERDAAFHQPLPEIPFPSNIFRCGRVTVQHSAKVLQEVSDDQGPLPENISVDIAYRTSYTKHRVEAGICSKTKHILIVHGTGFNKELYYWTKKSLRAAGHDNMASALSSQLESESIVDRLHAKEGVCVTTIDLRGHGNSSIPPGPWTVPLFAADIANALNQIHGKDVEVHAYGHSVGFGVVMSMAFNYPNMIRTVIGGGFLSDMSVNSVWAAYIFSRKIVARALGMELLGHAGEKAILVSSKGIVSNIMRYAPIEGYYRTSASWLQYTEAEKLGTLKAPLLWLHPIKDDLCGCTVPLVQNEFDKLPARNGNKLITYNATGDEDHCYPLLDPDRFFGDVLDFVRENSD